MANSDLHVNLEHYGQLVQRTVAAINNERPTPASATLPVAGWVEDANDVSGYAYHYDLSVAGVTADDIAHVVVPHSSQRAAVRCGLCPTNETLAGIIRFWAAAVPENAIAVNYWIQAQAVSNAD